MRQGVCQESLGKGTSHSERVGSNGDDPRCQTGTLLDWEDWSEAAAGREEVTGVTLCTPVDMMASSFKTWVAKWQKTQGSIRACAKADQDLPKIELKDLDEALVTMNEATGLGADRFGPVSSSPCQKMEDRGLLISSMNARNKLLGLGRYTSPWSACSPRR